MIVCKILDLSYDDFTFSLIHPSVSVNENIINSEVDIAMQNNDMKNLSHKAILFKEIVGRYRII